jgi:hypothetical protein
VADKDQAQARLRSGILGQYLLQSRAAASPGEPGRLAACSTTEAGSLAQPAAQCQSGWLAVQRKCPERRSNDGQAILEGRPDGRKPCLTWASVWSYGDPNPRPLACHESLARPAPGDMQPDQATRVLTHAAAGPGEHPPAAFCPSDCPSKFEAGIAWEQSRHRAQARSSSRQRAAVDDADGSGGVILVHQLQVGLGDVFDLGDATERQTAADAVVHGIAVGFRDL